MDKIKATRAVHPVDPKRVGAQIWKDPNGDTWAVGFQFVEINGRAECTGLTLDWCYAPDYPERPPLYQSDPACPTPTPLTNALIRRVAFGGLIDAARSSIPEISTILHALDEAAHERWGAPVPPPRQDKKLDVRAYRRTLITRDHLEKVALIYSEARKSNDPKIRKRPAQVVRERLHLSKSTANKHIMRCRAEGLLPPTTKGRAKH